MATRRFDSTFNRSTPQQITPEGITMATKVDRTASMMCRRHGCSSEKIITRLFEAEARCDELQAALDRIANFDYDTRVELASEVARDALKGNELDR